jgi:hypothetical protein
METQMATNTTPNTSLLELFAEASGRPILILSAPVPLSIGQRDTEYWEVCTKLADLGIQYQNASLPDGV